MRPGGGKMAEADPQWHNRRANAGPGAVVFFKVLR